MGTAFVLGHGGYDPELPWTFVPAGVTVHFHADFDEKILLANVVAILSDGAISPRESYASGQEIPNYCLAIYNDRQLISHMAIRPRLPGATTYFVGAEVSGPGLASLPAFTDHGLAVAGGPLLPLHTGPAPGSNEKCSPGQGHAHSCRGLFAELRAESDLHLLACRTSMGRTSPPSTLSLGAEKRHAYDRDPDAVRSGFVFDDDDDRFMPNLVRKRNALDEQVEQQRDQAGFAVEMETMPQATQASMAMSGLDSSWMWKFMQRSRWTPDDVKVVREHFAALGDPPATLEVAWSQQGWRNLLWIYLHGPAQVSAQTKSRLTLFALLRAHAVGPVEFLDDHGEVLHADVVQDSQIARFASGESGSHPGLDTGLVYALQTAIDHVDRVEGIKDRGIEDPAVIQEIYDITLTPGHSISDVLQQARTDSERLLEEVRADLYPELDRCYQRMCAYIAELEAPPQVQRPVLVAGDDFDSGSEEYSDSDSSGGNSYSDSEYTDSGDDY